MKKIICNKIKTPDGTILISKTVHDYKEYTDDNGFTYMVDGGNDYLRRNINNEAPEEELTVYSDDPHEEIREVFSWGTYGKTGKEKYKEVLLKDLTSNHICAIVNTQTHLRDYIIQMFKDELHYRNAYGDKGE